MRSMNREALLTAEDVCDYLQVNLRTVYRLIKTGKIPAARVGRRWIFVVDDEASIRALLSKMLAQAGYQGDVAPDGRSAVEQMRQ